MSDLPTTTERDYAYTDADFQRVCRLIYGRVGIVLKTGKEDMVYSRLVRRVRALQLASFREYLDRLESGRGAEDEWQAFTNALTTNLTSFFREAHHFDALTTHLQSRPAQTPLRIWSAAASTGEEPWSIAMTVAEHYGRFDVPVRIVATDVDTAVLNTARTAVYPLERIEALSIERKRRFFERGTGNNDGLCRVVEPLRRMVEFAPLNLLDGAWSVGDGYDAIFCRNVMIYFDKPTQLAILRRMLPRLLPSGLFFAGHSESYFHAAELMQPVGRTIYRRVLAAAA